jgi:hypothetical protein
VTRATEVFREFPEQLGRQWALLDRRVIRETRVKRAIKATREFRV